MFLNYPVSLPSFKEQARIVAILDKFDALTNDISIGLPAELKARRQQYEYYREKLLTFKAIEYANNKTYNLVAELCPNGVEFKALGKVIVSLKTGLNPRKNFILNTPDAQNYYVTVRELTGLNVKFLDKTDRVNDEGLRLINNRSNLEVGDVLFSGTGTVGRTALVKEAPKDWNVKEGIYIIKPIHSVINSMFLLYYLNSAQVYNEYSKKIVGSPVISLPMGDLKKFKIPLPPLAVQQEIVKILDTFTELETELEAELEARKKQYEHYRDEMLTFGEGVEFKELGKVGKFIRGNGMPKSDFTETGIGCIHYGQIYTYYGTFTDKTKSFVSSETAKKLQKVQKNDLIITNTSENLEDVCKTVVWLGDNEIVTGGHASIFKHKENPKYLAYYTQTPMFFMQKKKLAKGTKVIDVSAKDLAKIKIPLPPLAEQARIVAILDKFDALVNDISIGLPAELKARRQQYEYYREKLLTFKEIEYAK